MVKTYECVGHYQKRVGTRLRKLKKTTKGLKPLPDAVIDKLQNYFGMALRANTTGTAQKWTMLSGQVSCMSLVTNNKIIIRCANSHKRAGVNNRRIDLITRTYSNMDRVCPKR